MAQLFEDTILGECRRILFPAITQGITTGYNVYQQIESQSNRFRVNYLHSDLGFLCLGKPQPHLEELIGKFQKFGPPCIINKIVDSVVDRMAIYQIGDWENNPPETSFFSEKGNAIPMDKLVDYDGIIIAEGRQFDLALDVSTKRDLRKIIRLLEKFTYQFKVDRTGKVTAKPNQHAIRGSWKIPLITLSLEEGDSFSGFDPASQISFEIKGYNVRSIVKSPGPLFDYISKQGQQCIGEEKLVNKAFLKSYLEIPAGFPLKG